jgi:hypothetical protein
MGTRSTIAVKHGDRIKAVYCHWDGYIEHNGQILLKNYDSTKANFLVALGDISSLRENIGEKHSFDLRPVEGSEEETWTTFYGRDRGEDGTEWKSFDSEAEWMDYYDGSGAEYYYVMDNGVWYVSAYRDEFKPLHEEVAKLNKEEA